MWSLWSKIESQSFGASYSDCQALLEIPSRLRSDVERKRLDPRQRFPRIERFEVRLVAEEGIEEEVGASHAWYQPIRIRSALRGLQLQKKERRPKQERPQPAQQRVFQVNGQEFGHGT